MASATHASVELRRAEATDVPAIVMLVLTSFRQFPLFSFLYSPLYEDKSRAKDTIRIWKRRVLLDLLDPATCVVVAELPKCIAATYSLNKNVDDLADDESWQMLDWINKTQMLTQSSTNHPDSLIVGFAIWNDRQGVTSGESNKKSQRQIGWIDWLRRLYLRTTAYLESKIYTRKDVDPHRFQAYMKAEDTLEEQFYQDRCYYLDNLAVDFRYQRRGFGEALMRWGMDQAHEKQLPISTEASTKGLGLYQKLGFERIGWWHILDFELPVMRRPAP